MTTGEDMFRLGIGLGIGCAAGLVGHACEGMTPIQIAGFLEKLSENRGVIGAIASTCVDDAMNGTAGPGSYSALIEAVAEVVRVRGEG